MNNANSNNANGLQKILIVDDEDGIRDILKQYLEFDGFLWEEASNGQIAVEMCKNQDFDLVIMDVMMPFMDGITALRLIRESSTIPVILLTAKSQEYDKIFGFDLGADDYIVKPFSPKELIARVKAVLKRSIKVVFDDGVYKYKTMIVNRNSYEVKIDNIKIDLTPKEFEILNYFIKNKGIVITRDNLLNEIWGYDFFGDSRTVDTHIKMLRNNLGEYRDLIKTVWGVGYRYDD
ncbi:MAG: response regulator transcription factor [Oscillospiraceae bacterium]